jgi:hypothetical protein
MFSFSTESSWEGATYEELPNLKFSKMMFSDLSLIRSALTLCEKEMAVP